MVEIEQELPRLGRAVWAWVRGRGGATGSTAVARADHLQHFVFNGCVHPSFAHRQKKTRNVLTTVVDARKNN